MSFFLFLLLLPLQEPAPPAEHPVPLPADFDAAQCADCHADKQNGKHVHAAVAMGCTLCHQVNTENEQTTITLTAPRTELCATCHEAQAAPAVHGPYAKSECLSCHDPHAAEFPKLTLASTQALCTSCHLPRAKLEPNQPVALLASHTMDAQEFSRIPKIGLDRAGVTGHPYIGHPVTGGNDPFRPGMPYTCLSCHQPHIAPIKRLLNPDWKELNVCDRCHEAMKSQRGGTTP